MMKIISEHVSKISDMMNKITFTLAAICLGFTCLANPRRCPPPHSPPPPPCHKWHDNRSCNLWTSFASAAAGAMIGNAVSKPTQVAIQTSVVVQQPVVVTTPTKQPTTVVVKEVVVKESRQVWVEGRYIDVIQPNGTITKVWQPGHYETR